MGKSVDMQRVIHWFRQDLRLADNPALTQAAKQGSVLPVYILDDQAAGAWSVGAAGRCWLHYSLQSLNNNLENRLQLFRGDADQILPELAQQHQIRTVYWNQCYEPWRLQQDREIANRLREMGVEVEIANASLLWNPGDLLKADGTAYKVFTPFYRNGCLAAPQPRRPLPRPERIMIAQGNFGGNSIAALELLPKIRWDRPLISRWKIGEQGALSQLDNFLEGGLEGYKEGRNFPAQPHVSKLSPYLHWGEISVNQLWYEVQRLGDSDDVECFLRELCWREFSHSLLYHFNDLPHKNWQPKFDRFAWRRDELLLSRWQRGETGYPFVDAGMRELWQTGYMHNRVRMVVASFLVKNLLLDWREGEAWFWDCLLDADLANNAASWQWVAGCGADAAPYFRIFNPVAQGQKFDPGGTYTRRYVPELAALPDKYLFCPWQAPAAVLERAGVALGETYPAPVVDLKHSRELALSAFKQLSSEKAGE